MNDELMKTDQHVWIAVTSYNGDSANVSAHFSAKSAIQRVLDEFDDIEWLSEMLKEQLIPQMDTTSDIVHFEDDNGILEVDIRKHLIT